MTHQHNNFTDELLFNLEAFTQKIYQDIHQHSQPYLKQTGDTLESIANFPLLQSSYPWLGLHWLMYILGEVDHEKIQDTVETLRQRYPKETPQQLAHRIIIQQGIDAAKIGLITNLIPPFALLLLGLEFSALTKLQVEMIYQIAAVYHLDLKDPIRRGENLTLYGLSLGGGFIKTGLNIVEIIPGIGAIVGASSDALLLYGLGQVAAWLYEESASTSAAFPVASRQ